MAREWPFGSRAEASARSSARRPERARSSPADARARPARPNVKLEPNRASAVARTEAHASSMRRIAERTSVSPRPAARERNAGDPSAPRNRRVVRAPKRVHEGPSWVVRCSRAVRAKVGGSHRAVAGGLRRVSERWAGPTRAPVAIACQVLVCAAFAAGAIWMGRFVQHHLKTAPAFAIDAIDLRGLSRLDRAEVLQAAGLELGLNVFARSPEDVRARLLRHPWIVAAQVSRKLPSRFEITLQEREPVALLALEACADPPAWAPGVREEPRDDVACEEPSALYLVSREATLFKRVGGHDPVDLPVITGVTRQRFADEPELPRRVVSAAVQLLRTYRESGLSQRQPIGEIHLEPNDGFSLYLGEDLTYVRLGVPPFPEKLVRMKRVFERLEREHARAEYVYLDNEQRPERVVVRLR